MTKESQLTTTKTFIFSVALKGPFWILQEKAEQRNEGTINLNNKFERHLTEDERSNKFAYKQPAVQNKMHAKNCNLRLPLNKNGQLAHVFLTRLSVDRTRNCNEQNLLTSLKSLTSCLPAFYKSDQNPISS